MYILLLYQVCFSMHGCCSHIKCYKPGRPGGVAGYPRACYRSISWVRVPPSAYSYKFVGTFLVHKFDSRKARKRELATFDESRRAVRMLNRMRDKNWRHVPGGRRDDTWDHSLSRSWKVKVGPWSQDRLQWLWNGRLKLPREENK